MMTEEDRDALERATGTDRDRNAEIEHQNQHNHRLGVWRGTIADTIESRNKTVVLVDEESGEVGLAPLSIVQPRFLRTHDGHLGGVEV